MTPLTARELSVFELRCSGVRSGLVAEQLGLQRTLVSNAERKVRRKLFAMYKEAMMDANEDGADGSLTTTRDPYKMTSEEEYAEAEEKQSDRYVDGKLVKGQREIAMEEKLERRQQAIEKPTTAELERIEQVDIARSEKPSEGATPAEMRAWKLRMIGFKFPIAAAFLETVAVRVAVISQFDACIDELYDDATVFGGATTGDIDDTLGAGIGHMAHQESGMADNLFGGGGGSAGGIFGDGPIATSFHDPGESIRSAGLRKMNAETRLAEAQTRQLEGAQVPELQEGSDPKRLGEG